MAKRKKTRGFGIGSHVVDLGIREELWSDGNTYAVHAYQGVDRKVWIRFSKPFGFGIGKRRYCKGRGWTKEA